MQFGRVSLCVFNYNVYFYSLLVFTLCFIACIMLSVGAIKNELGLYILRALLPSTTSLLE